MQQRKACKALLQNEAMQENMVLYQRYHFLYETLKGGCNAREHDRFAQRSIEIDDASTIQNV
jgi:hypothetical protein